MYRREVPRGVAGLKHYLLASFSVPVELLLGVNGVRSLLWTYGKSTEWKGKSFVGDGNRVRPGEVESGGRGLQFVIIDVSDSLRTVLYPPSVFAFRSEVDVNAPVRKQQSHFSPPFFLPLSSCWHNSFISPMRRIEFDLEDSFCSGGNLKFYGNKENAQKTARSNK